MESIIATNAPNAPIIVNGKKGEAYNVLPIFTPEAWVTLPEAFTAAFTAHVMDAGTTNGPAAALLSKKGKPSLAKATVAFQAIKKGGEIALEEIPLVIGLTHATHAGLKALLPDLPELSAETLAEDACIFLMSAEEPTVVELGENEVNENAPVSPATEVAESIIENAASSPEATAAVIEAATEVAEAQNLPTPTNLEEAGELVLSGSNATDFILGIFEIQGKGRSAVMSGIQKSLQGVQEAMSALAAQDEAFATHIAQYRASAAQVEA